MLKNLLDSPHYFFIANKQLLISCSLMLRNIIIPGKKSVFQCSTWDRNEMFRETVRWIVGSTCGGEGTQLHRSEVIIIIQMNLALGSSSAFTNRTNSHPRSVLGEPLKHFHKTAVSPTRRPNRSTTGFNPVTIRRASSNPLL